MFRFDPREFKFPHELLRHRLRRFAIKPWEHRDSNWNPRFISACLWSRYVNQARLLRNQRWARKRIPGVGAAKADGEAAS